MLSIQTLVNRYGEQWNVEYRESGGLTSIGGYLMSYGAQGCITLSAMLPANEKARGMQLLACKLAALPLGRAGTYLWHPDDE